MTEMLQTRWKGVEASPTTGARWRRVDLPAGRGANQRSPRGRNRATVVGLLTALLAFATVAAGQTIVLFDADPAATRTVPTSISASGDVTGSWLDGNQGTKERGFVRKRNGTITVFDADPAATRTSADGINSSGDVTGSFRDGNQGNKFRGFVRSPN